MMMQRNVFVAAFFCAASWTAAQALALPKALDRIPAEAAAVLVTKPLEEIDRDVSKLQTATDMIQLPTPQQLLATLGLGQGLDMSRSMAIALMPGDMGAEMPPAVALLPVSDYDGMMNALGAAKNEAGLHSMTIRTGETLFAKEIEDGYAAVSPMQDLVAAFSGKAGQMAAHRESIGAVGLSVIEESHIALVVKESLLAVAGEQLDQAIQENMQGMGAMMGGDADQMQEQVQKIGDFVKSLLADSRDLVLGTSAGSMGMGFEAVMDFTPGSDSAEMFRGGGDSARLLGRLPNQDFIFVSAQDQSSPGMRRLVQTLTGLAPGGVMGGVDFKQFAGLINGQASAIYASPGGIMGGLLANTINIYTSDKPDELLAVTKKMMKEGLDLDQAMGGAEAPFDISFSVTENDAEIEGVSVDAWSTSFGAGDGQAAMMQQQMMGMLFGPGGLGGYIAAAHGGVYQTLSKNRLLMAGALQAAKDGDSLAGERMVEQVGDRLPGGRTGEMYIGVRTIMEQAIQAAGMFGMPLNIELPVELPPIGIGIKMSNSAGRATAFIPAPVIKTIGDVANQVQQMQMQGPGGMNGDGDAPF